ncbi:MAG: UvrD-helicase domain-containing protein [Bacteroides sp.]|nr:UvrD-helicase domain-containing protein [Bacteroides sp.]
MLNSPIIISFVIALLFIAAIIARIVVIIKANRLTKELTTTEDIKGYINNNFINKYISFTNKDYIRDLYTDVYFEASKLTFWLEKLFITQSYDIMNLISDFENIDTIIKTHNDHYFKEILRSNKDFFDKCLKYPLDNQQRRAIISEEDNCLVVSSAGSGKTSSIVGKVKYLIEKKGIDPKRILLISYTNKAAAELTERVNIDGLRGYTFHKLALDIIGQQTGVKPSICDNTDALFVKIYRELQTDAQFCKHIVEYFIDFQSHETESDRQENELRQNLSEQKSTRLKAILPDMDGHQIYVRSHQEQTICFLLSSFGVKFRYEEAYEHPVADSMHSQYKPDFSIYYEVNGRTRRIYLEHFGVDDHSLVPQWFAKDMSLTYEEANKLYNDGIAWKKAAHQKFGTTLLTTSSAVFKYGTIKERLKQQLIEAGVPITEYSDDDLFNLVIPKGSNREKAFIRLIATFVTLLKSNCRSITDVLSQVRNADDEKSESLIEYIFRPVYRLYEKTLHDSDNIDFTDAILQATEICRKFNPNEYDFIIVDEFQDISMDRYNFLKALRGEAKPAKLYCVGDDWQSIYRFSGSDMALFNKFSEYFGPTEINKIETTYRFGEPLVSQSSKFIQNNSNQIKKNIRPFSKEAKTELSFVSYNQARYCDTILQLIASIPTDKSIFLLGRYSFDDYFLSLSFKSVKEGNRFYYIIGNRKIEFLTVHKSKGLEADYVILLQCNRATYGFPSLVTDDSSIQYLLTDNDIFPHSEERRLFYVAITRAKVKTWVLYEENHQSVFVKEFINPETITETTYLKHPNRMKKWTKREDRILLSLHSQGKSIRYIAEELGRTQTSIVMRLGKFDR